MIQAGKLRDRIRIEYRSTSQDATYGSQTVTWTALATVRAEVQDVLPSRAERQNTGVRIENRPARVRMRYRSDVTSDMRLVLLDRASRVMHIVAGPAEIGNREGIELMAEEWTTQGDAP